MVAQTCAKDRKHRSRASRRSDIWERSSPSRCAQYRVAVRWKRIRAIPALWS